MPCENCCVHHLKAHNARHPKKQMIVSNLFVREMKVQLKANIIFCGVFSPDSEMTNLPFAAVDFFPMFIKYSAAALLSSSAVLKTFNLYFE